MRSTTLLLFTLLASSLLAVFPVPVLEARQADTLLHHGSEPQNPRKRPFEYMPPKNTGWKKPRKLKPLVTLIGRMNDDLGNDILTGTTALSRAIFNEGFNVRVSKLRPEYRGRNEADTIGPNPLRRWYYFTLINYEDCIQEAPCFGWIARGNGYQIEKLANGSTTVKPDILASSITGKTYAGISPGRPAQNGFVGEQGNPVANPVTQTSPRDPRVLIKMQQEWRQLLIEFNERFMNSSFVPLGGTVPPP
ncbi:hypothetical protein BDP27DRAFT_1434484 [Rhodocollybia butyracea]|uniref:Uncharacterized protein n=1 Tax=Rhodocollybia butyracea TaxID=206335 RepID=A0A9P5P3G0_9AGAR|nr:hypothetical protein BDP27DRAFT_1434484 [Rhodocollybia butyracea]